MKKSDRQDLNGLLGNFKAVKTVKTQLQEEDWCFIQKDKYKCTDKEKPILFRYELGRELGLAPGSEYLLLSSVFKGYFPDTPYLKIPIKIRTDLWKQAFEPDSGHIPLFDPSAPIDGFNYTYRYAMGDNVWADTWQDQASLNPDDYDYSVALIQLHLDFDQPDCVLVQKFAEMLKQLRKTESVYDSRGKPSIDSALKQLAATRLLDCCGTPENAQAYVSDHDYDLPYGGGNSGWYKAKGKIAQWKQKAPA